MTIKRKNCSPLSVALTGDCSPQGGAFLSNKTASGNQAFHPSKFLRSVDQELVTKPQATKKASPWGEVPSLSRRRGVMTNIRLFVRVETAVPSQSP